MPTKAKTRRHAPRRFKAYLAVPAYGWLAIDRYAAARGLDLSEDTKRGLLSAALQRALVMDDWQIEKMLAKFWRLARREWRSVDGFFRPGWNSNTIDEAMARPRLTQIYATIAREAQRRWGADFGGRPILMAALYEFLDLPLRERAKLMWYVQDRQDAQRRADAQAAKALQAIYR
jgi:hypothetical protein